MTTTKTRPKKTVKTASRARTGRGLNKKALDKNGKVIKKTNTNTSKKTKTLDGNAGAPIKDKAERRIKERKKSVKEFRPKGDDALPKQNVVNPDTGYYLLSDLDKVATALMKGATTRQDIIDKLKDGGLAPKTRTGSDKPVSNLVSSVVIQMLNSGKFELKSWYQIVPKESKGGHKKRPARKEAGIA